MRIVLSGGGTAGHITPLLAVAHELKKLSSDVELLYVGNKHDHLADMVVDQLPTKLITSGKWRRFHGSSKLRQLLDIKTQALNLRDLGRFLRGYRQSRKLLKQFNPDVVFVKGGYVGLPLGLAAHRLNVRLVIHDSDIVPGLTNRILGRFADTIATGFPEQYYDYPSNKLIHTGNIVRSEFKTTTMEQGRAAWPSLDQSKPWIFVTGGSQGAHYINEMVLKLLKDMPYVCVLHATGKRWPYEEQTSSNYVSRQFISNMAEAMAAADIIVTRAGATSVSEAAIMKKALIVIPHPHLSGGHQIKNARSLQEAEAAIVIEQDTPKAQTLLHAAIDSLLDSPMQAVKLGANLVRFSHPDSAQDIAKVLLRL